MSQRREKKRRAKLKEAYNYQLELWVMAEPPKWKFISHWLWGRKKPVFDTKADK